MIPLVLPVLPDANGPDAVLSADLIYRYWLRRPVDPPRPIGLFIMLNPSTADASLDDPTIRRCMGLCTTWGLQLEVVNLFAYRATDPEVLKAASEAEMVRSDIIGPENDAYIEAAVLRASRVFVAWGNHGSLLGRDKEVLRLIVSLGARPEFLPRREGESPDGLTKEKQPQHPLYVPSGIEPRELPLPFEVISSFQGEYRFLSNFYPALITLKGGEVYPSTEYAYQALKTLDPDWREAIRTASTPGVAKRIGAAISKRPGLMRADWHQGVKIEVMRRLLQRKFEQHPDLMERLKATGDAVLCEGNNWKDTEWGVYDGRGRNLLGRLLMEVRDAT